MSAGSNYNCGVCGRTPKQGPIYRTSPKGGPFRGVCEAHLATRDEDLIDFMHIFDGGAS